MPASFTPLSLARTGRQPSPLRRLAPLALAALLGCASTAALAQSGHRVVAQTGQAPPGVPVLGNQITDVISAQVNDAGQVAWSGFYGAAPDSTANTGIWRDTTLVARTGQAMPGLPLTTATALQLYDMDEQGNVLWWARVTGLGVTAANEELLYSGTRRVARSSFDGGGLLSLGVASYAGTDAVAYWDFRASGLRIRLEDDTLAEDGAPAFDGLTYGSFGAVSGNAAGRVVFGGRASAGTTGVGFVQAGQRFAMVGTSPPPGLPAGSVIFDVEDARVGAQGALGFTARFAGPGDVSGLAYFGNGQLLGRSEQQAPGMPAGNTLVGLGGVLAVDDVARTLWTSAMAGSSFATGSGTGLWRDRTLLARTDAASPIDGVRFSGSSFLDVAAGASGQVAFVARLQGLGVTEANDRGLFISDGVDTLLVAREGDAFGGNVVAEPSLSDDAVNRNGQVVFVTGNVYLEPAAVVLWTPALRWRSTSSGSWADAARWTLGLNPAAVHDVAIDPATSLTVTLGGAPVSVNSLMVGNGGGMATLRLDGGDLAITDGGLQLASRGILSGEGFVRAEVTNHGEVRPTNLVIDSRLVNHGIVRGSASGVARLETELRNDTGGQLRLAENEQLLLVDLGGSGHNNQGRIELKRGSELEVRGLISNESSGRISVDGGTLRFADVLENSGQLLVGFGGATVHGHIDNDFGGKIIVSGASQATFFDLVDLGSGSELRVAGGSQALFFGEVVRRAGSLLTGTGTKFFEGGLTVPGSSGSAALRDEGSAVFGDGGTVAFELDAAGGAERLQVAGSLGFGGVLRLASSGSFVAQVGQRFDLFGWGSACGSFSSIDASGLLLAGDAMLDFSRLYVDGSVSVTAVPEPGTWATLLAGLAVLGGLQRRRRA